jgi:hypothetical protein
MPPFTQLERFGEHAVNFKFLSGQQNHQIWTWTTVISFEEYSEEQILACNIPKATSDVL